MQIKMTKKYHYKPIKMVKILTPAKVSVDKVVVTGFLILVGLQNDTT